MAALALNVVLSCSAAWPTSSATLTLPGIAGIILTIGMAVDANVLVFERIREELRAGRTVRSAIDAGFDKALSSIIDSNITTLIAALFLFQFGTGPIRGFAVTLSIGILATLFAGVFVSRWLFDLVLFPPDASRAALDLRTPRSTSHAADSRHQHRLHEVPEVLDRRVAGAGRCSASFAVFVTAS